MDHTWSVIVPETIVTIQDVPCRSPGSVSHGLSGGGNGGLTVGSDSESHSDDVVEVPVVEGGGDGSAATAGAGSDAVAGTSPLASASAGGDTEAAKDSEDALADTAQSEGNIF